VGGCVQHCVVTSLTDNTAEFYAVPGSTGFSIANMELQSLQKSENSQEGASRYNDPVALTSGAQRLRGACGIAAFGWEHDYWSFLHQFDSPWVSRAGQSRREARLQMCPRRVEMRG
jgi:hypothetical protein